MVSNEVTHRLDGDTGASSQKLIATPRCARRPAGADIMRAPVNRQTTMMLASPSTALPSAQPVKAIDPAVMPATKPTAPSAVIQAREAQASKRACRVYRSQRSSRLTPGPVLSQQVQASGRMLPAEAGGSEDTRPAPWHSSST
jgi:hypothetical protein